MYTTIVKDIVINKIYTKIIKMYVKTLKKKKIHTLFLEK